MKPHKSKARFQLSSSGEGPPSGLRASESLFSPDPLSRSPAREKAPTRPEALGDKMQCEYARYLLRVEVPQGGLGEEESRGAERPSLQCAQLKCSALWLHRGALLQQVLEKQRVVWTLMTSVSHLNRNGLY